MLESDLTLLYDTTWRQATDAERQALRQASGLADEASPFEVFTTIAQHAPLIDPRLVSFFWPELDIKMQTHRAEIGDVPLSQSIAQALNMAMAYELGQRIDRVLSELPEDDLTQEELESKSAAHRVHWHVIAYALTRKQQGLSE